MSDLAIAGVRLSKDTIDQINVLVDRHWRNADGTATKLYYLGVGPYQHSWMLDGMSPVTYDFVIQCLEWEGDDVTQIKKAIDADVLLYSAKVKRRKELIASARAKLTEEEAEACGFGAETFFGMCYPNP